MNEKNKQKFLKELQKEYEQELILLKKHFPEDWTCYDIGMVRMMEIAKNIIEYDLKV